MPTFFNYAVLFLALGAAIAFLAPHVLYYRDLVSALSGSAAYYAAHVATLTDPDATFSAFGGNVVTSHVEVKRRQLTFSRDIAEGRVKRTNSLGIFRLADSMFTFRPKIALGMDDADHSVVRPWIDRVAWGAEQTWTTEEVERDVRELLAARPAMPSVKVSISKIVLHVLHTRMLGRGAAHTWNDTEAFAAYQGQMLMHAVLPDALNSMSWAESVRTEQRRWLDLYAAGLTDDAPPGPTKEWKAWTWLTALTFAGGLGTPTLIHNALAVLCNTKFELSPATMDRFIMETSRLHPPVPEIMYDRRDAATGEYRPEVLVAGYAARDTSVWGEDAAEFKLRPLAEYHRNLAAFGEWTGMGEGYATPDEAERPTNVDLRTQSRGCPGKHFTYVIARTILTELAGTPARRRASCPSEAIAPQSPWGFADFALGGGESGSGDDSK